MSEPGYVLLAERGLLGVGGPEARDFLQGLISNDVRRAGPGRAIYAAILTPQGKFLFDVLIHEIEDGTLLLDAEGPRLGDLMRRLMMYRLRAKVELADVSDRFAVAAVVGDGAAGALGLAPEAGAARPLAGGSVAIDPRLASLGARAVLPQTAIETALRGLGLAPLPFPAYERLRLAHGVPDGSRDLPVEKAILLENGFEELNGVDFEKGCFVGQELTARTKHRALIRKRLLPVTIAGPAPEPGTPVMLGEREAGEMRTSLDDRGLALMRLEAVARAEAEALPLTAGAATLAVLRPAWMRWPGAGPGG